MHTLQTDVFDRNINGNRGVKFLECDYLFLQRCVKLTLSTYYIIYWVEFIHDLISSWSFKLKYNFNN